MQLPLCTLKGHPHASMCNVPIFWAEFLAVWSKYYARLLREFPDKSSNFGLLYGREYGPLSSKLNMMLILNNMFTNIPISKSVTSFMD